MKVPDAMIAEELEFLGRTNKAIRPGANEMKAMKHCTHCQTPAACKAHEECLKPPAKERADSESDALPCWAALWLCNKCGHEFAEIDAAGEEVSPYCDEIVIACPKCYANNLDEDGSLTHPDDRLPNSQADRPQSGSV